MAETIHDRVKALMKKHGLKQKQLALALGITPQAVNAWFRKGTEPSRANLYALSELFHVSVDELTARTTNGARNENSIMRIDTYSGNPIPMRVLGRISVSRMLHEADNGHEAIAKIPVPFFTGPSADAFIMLDDSMGPKIGAGDIVVIDYDKPYQAEKLIAAHIKSLGAEVFRKFIYDGPDHCALVPLTPGHRSYRFTHEQWAEDVEVLGTYVGSIHHDE